MPTNRRRYNEKNDLKISQLTILPSLAEADVLDGDIYGLIAPYATANFWVLPIWLKHSQTLTLKLVVALPPQVSSSILRRCSHSQHRSARFPIHILHYRNRGSGSTHLTRQRQDPRNIKYARRNHFRGDMVSTQLPRKVERHHHHVMAGVRLGLRCAHRRSVSGTPA
jgi:hypothetical protein